VKQRQRRRRIMRKQWLDPQRWSGCWKGFVAFVHSSAEFGLR